MVTSDMTKYRNIEDSMKDEWRCKTETWNWMNVMDDGLKYMKFYHEEVTNIVKIWMWSHELTWYSILVIDYFTKDIMWLGRKCNGRF